MLSKLYRSAYYSSGVVMILGLIWLDEYVHTWARVPAGLLATSPYWLHYMAVYSNGALNDNSTEEENCEHTFESRSEGYSDPTIWSYCTKCGKIKK